MRNPVKLLKLELARVPDTDPNTRTKWLYECEHCKGHFKRTDVQVDHIHGNHTFTKITDFESYYDNILNVTLDDLQVLCVPCHELKTYMDSNPHLTEEEAWKAKAVLAWFRKYPKAGQQKQKLSVYGYTGAAISNDEKRQAIVLELVEQGVVKW